MGIPHKYIDRYILLRFMIKPLLYRNYKWHTIFGCDFLKKFVFSFDEWNMYLLCYKQISFINQDVVLALG